MSAKQLGKVTAVLADLGLEVTYAYDDLVFVQDCAFLLKFTEEHDELLLYVNTDCDPEVANPMGAEIVLAMDKQSISMLGSGRYSLEEGANDTVNITFE